MPSEAERSAVFHRQAVWADLSAIKGLNHAERARVADDRRLGIGRRKGREVGRVVGLHVLHDQIVRLASVQRRRQLRQPLRAKPRLYRIHDCDFIV